MPRKSNPASRRARAERRRKEREALNNARREAAGLPTVTSTERKQGDVKLTDPPAYILARRKLFSFVEAKKGGNIDQDICDAIGQLHACGLLDNHAHDPQELRDKGRLYAELWWKRYAATAPKTGRYERASRSTANYDGLTPADLLFERLDQCLIGYERDCVFDLCVDDYHSDEMTPWAASLIAECLLQRGRLQPKPHAKNCASLKAAEQKCDCGAAHRFPTMDDKARLHACIQGLVALVEGTQMRKAA